MTVPGAALMELASSSRRELILCAPFAKKAVVARILSVVDHDVRLILFTRWRPDEVAAGVSDTQVLDVVHSRGGTVLLHDRLHAKYYRNESRTLLGSANLTATALGWSAAPNLELLVDSSPSEVRWLESELHAKCTIATEEIAAEVAAIADLLIPGRAIPLQIDIAHSPAQSWVPALRLPADLFVAYTRGVDALTLRSADAARADLTALDVPPGLSREQFERLIGNRLLGHDVFRTIDAFVAEPRRFGEVRDLIADYLDIDRRRADEAWQTIMRWMLQFLPMRYTRSQARHSEIIARRALHGG